MKRLLMIAAILMLATPAWGTDLSSLYGNTGLGSVADGYVPYDDGNVLTSSPIAVNSDNVGIGTAAATTKLHVVGTGDASTVTLTVDSDYQVYLLLRSDVDDDDTASSDVMMVFNVSNADQYWSVGVDDSDSDSFKIGPGYGFSTPSMTFLSGGNVGIGTASPVSTLTVSGAEATHGEIELWADDGDDNDDRWMFRSHTGGTFYILKYNGSGYTANLGIDSTGAVTKPNNPAFSALNTVTDANVTGDSTVFAVEFNSEIFDQGGNYNETTDTFTAPVDGKYLLRTCIFLDGLDVDTYEVIVIKLVTSNRSYNRYDHTDSTSNGQGSFCISSLSDMDTSDTATVTVMVQTGTKSVDVYGSLTSFYTFFQGHLTN